MESARDAANAAATAAGYVDAQLVGTVLTVTDRTGHSEQADLKGEKGDNLVWESMDSDERQAVINAVAAQAGNVATVEECRRAAAEIVFVSND